MEDVEKVGWLEFQHGLSENKTLPKRLAIINWAVLSDEQMSNKVGVEHQPVNFWVVVSNIVDFPSLLGEVILFDEHILQMGWFNHQLVLERNPEKRKKLYQEAIIYNKPCGCPLRLP